jgi:hypothetical protein
MMTFTTKYGTLRFDPANGLTTLELPEEPGKLMRVRGSFKRFLLTLASKQADKLSLPYVSMN